MKLLTFQQLRDADRYTLEKQRIRSIELMERAAKACTDWLLKFPVLNRKKKVTVFCGLGNNGGDGLAIARLLSEKKIQVEVCIIRHSDKASEDFHLNLERIEKNVSIKISSIYSDTDFQTICLKDALVVDALFGSGLNRPLEGLPAGAIEYINSSAEQVVSVDIPSGLLVVPGSKPGPHCIRAGHTLTFTTPKLVFMFPDYYSYLGEFTVLDIGLDEEFLKEQESINYFVTSADVKELIKPRKKFSHKGSYGHALLIAGSYGKIGAALLASGACLKSGSGLLTVHLPKCGFEIIQTVWPEAMVSIDSGTESVSSLPDLDRYNSIGTGPGLGLEKQTQGAVKLLIQNSKCPLVLDADALNILSENKTWLSFLPGGSILTPHPKEFERLTEKASTDYQRYGQIRDFAFKYNIYLVLKGAHTAIACPDGRVYFNSTGNPGMAKGGSGDVLTGLLTGLLAQGYSSLEACIIGVYWHGWAGDCASEKMTGQVMGPMDILDNLGNAFKTFLD